MKRLCPNCQREVEDYQQFCPFCDYDFPSTDDQPTEPLKPEKAEAEGKSALACPICGKSVEPYHEWCPWCDADLPAKEQDGANSDTPIRKPEELGKDATILAPEKENHDLTHHASPLRAENTKPCPFCGKSVPLNFMLCGYCGKPLAQGGETEDVAASEGHYKSPTVWQQIPAAHPPPGPGFPAMPTSPEVLAVGTDAPWDSIPISLFFNAGKKYTEKTTDILEFMVMNTLPQPVEGLEISLRCRLCRQPIQSRVTVPLPPGVQYPLPIGGFFPDQPGRDVLQMSIDGKVMDGQGFHLTGSAAVEVLNREQKPTSINVNISAQGPVIGDVELGLLGQDSFGQVPSAPVFDRWVPLQLVWNIKEQQRESRFFPPGCVNSLECVWDANMVSALECLAPDAVPQVALITPHNTTYCLLTGTIFSLGRGREMNHICTVLYPEEIYKQKNRMISRQHCRISIQNCRVSIQDISSNGTWLGDRRLPRNEDLALADGDKINIGGVLELQASIFTNGEQVLGILLRRTQNRPNMQYVLARGPIPVGSRPGIPIAFPGISEICGVLFYHPMDRTWHFNPNGMQSGSPEDLRLDSDRELPIQNATFRFSLMR
jgi:endogenous inhibitor of DNA gyrase (YacG/DUF329 family)